MDDDNKNLRNAGLLVGKFMEAQGPGQTSGNSHEVIKCLEKAEDRDDMSRKIQQKYEEDSMGRRVHP